MFAKMQVDVPESQESVVQGFESSHGFCTLHAILQTPAWHMPDWLPC